MMKKMHFLPTFAKISILATALFAVSTSMAEDNQPIQETRPYLVFGSVDGNAKAKTLDITVRRFSKTQLDNHFCWRAFNLPQVENTKFTITITSEKNSTFSMNKMISSNKTTHVFNTILPIHNNSAQSCWKFEQTDPLGKYSLTVVAGEIAFPIQYFELTK